MVVYVIIFITLYRLIKAIKPTVKYANDSI